jgi:hypothetical protein
MYKKSKAFFEEFEQDEKLFKEKKFHLYISQLKGISMKPLLIDEWSCSDDFANETVASGYFWLIVSFIPGVTGMSLYHRAKNHYCFDGGFTKAVPAKYPHTKKLFVNVLPNVWPFVFNIPPNCTVLNINEVFGLTFPNDYWNWSTEFSDDMFLKGYLAGEKLKQQILTFFLTN